MFVVELEKAPERPRSKMPSFYTSGRALGLPKILQAVVKRFGNESFLNVFAHIYVSVLLNQTKLSVY